MYNQMLIKMVCEEWFCQSSRSDWDTWSLEEAAGYENETVETDEGVVPLFPEGTTAEDIYETMQLIIAEYDRVNAE